ncbi:hypothetical protein ABZZ20_18905 [Streptomyces sp. NPDC006430]|uniref:hypothetical protein n=1 Tax=Streptomyces sp. NPDC006430 TaxID=3154299 RepID=UPI0033B1749D
MSTPEEQQHQQHQDPYGTQTWQSDTWDTGYQPVHEGLPEPYAQHLQPDQSGQPAQPRLGGLPGQSVAPEGWFRDDAPAPRDPAGAPGWSQGSTGAPWADGAGAAEQTAYLPPQSAPNAAEPQPAAPEGWFRHEAPNWSAPAAETAYLLPYPGPGAVDPQPAAPEGWFRDEAPASPAPASPASASAPAPAAGWSQGGGSAAAWTGPAAEQTAYLPPQAPAPVGGAAEETAFLPPYPGPGGPAATPSASGVAPAAPDAPGEAPAYSPPTLGGNTVRAVDPAQARAEGRSPIIDPGPQSAVLTAGLGLLLAGAAAVGDLALLVPLIALQGLTAAGWFRLNGMWPARQGIALAFLGALVADGAVLAVDATYGPGAIIGTLGAWVLLTLVLQLRSHADPDERMYGLMASVASAALAIICAGYLAADSAAVSVGAVAVAVAVFTRALPLPTAGSVGVSLAAAAGAGIAIGGLTDLGVGGALLGLAAGVCALIGLRVAAYDYPSKFVHMTAGVALPLAAAAPAVYLIGRVVG